ncbi:DivIVA domain-containing protein [Arthrobacter sp. ISL-48]|uniref:DivIVA domain-containing protein n=1 Tax=Arthrobacter sp. ISL-48 TaxID=2819110 RepID=UPI001BEBB25D|nr:DivIVA domain-containing protein [Arthrobacter sp. ISL-48]MBT2531955.1 DivIVA domain-containing protein [Arthrobacter sp. ISL-48]
MSFFLVFLAIVLIGATVWAGAGRRRRIFRRGPSADVQNDRLKAGSLLYGGFDQPVANLPPVLLPAEAAPDDVDRIRFSLGLRGYRMDQVDQVLDELRDQLAANQEEMERLRIRLLEAERPRAAALPVAEPEPEGSTAKTDPSGAEGEV